MLPVVALVGRPNVGKSTLFNRLTGSRDALVADFPGLTRDRLYGFSRDPFGPAIVIDTGGLMESGDELAALIRRQVELAVKEADAVIVLVDGQAGPTPEDSFVAELIRRTGKPLVLAVNKTEGRRGANAVAEFFELGLGEPVPMSASHGEGVRELFDAALSNCPAPESEPDLPEAAGTRIAVIGRPNVGKSTLINRYLREDRLVIQDEPGTTRDAIYVPFSFDGKPYTLIDTAGIRRRARVSDTIEKFSIAKALQAVEQADAVIVLLDAQADVTEQDVSLIGLILERGRALTLGINKWDGLPERRRREVMAHLNREAPFLDFVDIHPLSALHGTNIVELFKSAVRAARSGAAELSTQRLNDVLQEIVLKHPPPIARRRRIKLSYAHQGGRRPPLIVVHGNQTEHLPDSYKRYLISRFRAAFRLKGTPIRLELRSGRNPFAGRRNTLSARQVKKRRRLRDHAR